MKKADLILSADYHLRETIPQCRDIDFMDEQWEALKFISDLQVKHECPVVCAGDLFDYWKPSPWLLSNVLNKLPNKFYSVYGNHDLPDHSIQLYEKCGMYTLLSAGHLSTLPQGDWNSVPNDSNALQIGNKKVLVWHKFVWNGKNAPWDGAAKKVNSAKYILKKYPNYDLILTGDNHQSFSYRYKNRLLVNPGPITRQDVNMENIKPKVFLWYADINRAVSVNLPTVGRISKVHIERKKIKEKRIEAYISQLDGKWDVSINFPKNIRTHLKVNEVEEKVKQIVLKAIENETNT